jgi:hypothetical protein
VLCTFGTAKALKTAAELALRVAAGSAQACVLANQTMAPSIPVPKDSAASTAASSRNRLLFELTYLSRDLHTTFSGSAAQDLSSRSARYNLKRQHWLDLAPTVERSLTFLISIDSVWSSGSRPASRGRSATGSGRSSFGSSSSIDSGTTTTPNKLNPVGHRCLLFLSWQHT